MALEAIPETDLVGRGQKTLSMSTQGGISDPTRFKLLLAANDCAPPQFVANYSSKHCARDHLIS